MTPRLAGLFLANLLQASGASLLLHLPAHLHNLGATEAQVGVLMAVGAFVTLAASPLLGHLLDRVSGRLLLASAAAVAACSALAFLLVLTVSPALVLLIITIDLAVALLHAAFYHQALDQLAPAERTRGIGLFGISSMAAVGLGALLGDVALAALGPSGLFQLMALLLLTPLLLAALQPSRGASSGADPQADPSAGGYFAAMTTRSLRPIWTVSLGFFVAMASVFVFLKLTVSETGIGSLGLYFGIYTAVAIGLRLLAGTLPDRLGHERAARWVLGSYASGFLVLGFGSSLMTFCLAAVLGGIGHGYGYPLLLSMATERVDPSRRGSAVTTFNAIDEGAVLLAAPAFGLLLESGSPTLLYGAAAAAALAGALPLLLSSTPVANRPSDGSQ